MFPRISQTSKFSKSNQRSTTPRRRLKLVIEVEIESEEIALATVDAVILVCAESRGENFRLVVTGGPRDIRAPAFAARINRALLRLNATGELGTVHVVAPTDDEPSPLVVVAGVGREITTTSVRAAAGNAVRAASHVGRVALMLPNDHSELVTAQVEGACLGLYDYKGRRDSTARPALVIPKLSVDTATAAERGRVLADAAALARDLINRPAGDLSPVDLADAAVACGTGAGLSVQVFDEGELARAGFGGILGVGAGSSRPPRLVRLQYRPVDTDAHVAIVGKGITFDAGGIAIKGRLQMETMKGDMSGAAAALGATVAAAMVGLPVNVTTWLACAENVPSSTAIRPGDVLKMYGGTTVEVLNPDAEGRLVLADGLARASEDAPDVLLNIGTLTGAGKVLGPMTGAVMSNDRVLASAILDSAAAAGEDFWPMPLPALVRSMLDSPVADLANVLRDGVIDSNMLTAGVFLQEFVGRDISWASLDIPFYNFGPPYNEYSTGGLAFGLRTLFELCDRRSRA